MLCKKGLTKIFFVFLIPPNIFKSSHKMPQSSLCNDNNRGPGTVPWGAPQDRMHQSCSVNTVILGCTNTLKSSYHLLHIRLRIYLFTTRNQSHSGIFNINPLYGKPMHTQDECPCLAHTEPGTFKRNQRDNALPVSDDYIWLEIELWMSCSISVSEFHPLLRPNLV